MTTPDSRIAVVGAGVIGTAIALELQRAGQNVLLIDRNAPGQGASFGNMASIATAYFTPASCADVWRQIPGWLLSREAPVVLRPGALPGLLPWFWRFLLAGSPTRVAALTAAGAALSLRALNDTRALLRDLGAEAALSDRGCLAIYGSDRALNDDRGELRAMAQYGAAHRLLTRAEIKDLEPELSEAIRHAVLLPDNRTIRDPHEYVQLMARRFQALGGEIRRGEVRAPERGTGLRLENGDLIAAKTVVLAAGVQTARLARRAGEALPLVAERGYHTQIMAPGMDLSHALIWPERGFMISPTAGGIRVGGTVELAREGTPPDWRRAEIMVRHAQTALPGLRAEGTSRWMGRRPVTPDTIPVLSPSAQGGGLFYATGHGHLGLTQAATTARLMGQLITGARPEIDLAPYGITRF